MPPPHPQCDGVAVKKHYAALEELSKPLADEQYHVFEVPLHVAFVYGPGRTGGEKAVQAHIRGVVPVFQCGRLPFFS